MKAEKTTADALRKKYIDFMVSKGHVRVPSAPLIPENNPSLLFVNAGMVPLIPYLMGQPHPMGKRITSIQKCLRTEDIDGVGSAFRHTFFEMLGHWSLGDYFKKEAIEITYEFLTRRLGIDPSSIYVTIFEGNDNVGYDKESERAWINMGIPKERIFAFGEEENWWSAGETGPCGPDSEVWIDTGKKPCGSECKPSCKCGKYVEIWNNVFMEFNKLKDGRIVPLKQKNVDVGIGVDRTTTILEGLDDNYKASHWKPVIRKIEELSGKSYDETENRKAMRIIADHARAAAFCLSENITPSNTLQGYVVRRIIRRALRYGSLLGMPEKFLTGVVEEVISVYSNVWGELVVGKKLVMDEISKEESKFSGALKNGEKFFEKFSEDFKSAGFVSGKIAFDLYQTYGFPIEMTMEMAKERGLKVKKKEFDKLFEDHRNASRSGAGGLFKGGLASASEMETKYHTATHLLHSALRKVLGETVRQKGSNITAQRLRFDFSFDRKLTNEEVKRVEDIVNAQIKKNINVKCKVSTLKQAVSEGALAFFMERYPEKVKVYQIGDFSKEVCSGPHVKNTGSLGNFKIIGQDSVGSGVRRIKAVLEK